MSYFVYMLKSIEKRPVTYVGYTNNIKKRIITHNAGKGAKFTRGRKWKYIYIKKYNSKSLAMKNEYLLKKDVKKRNSIKFKFI